MKSPSPETKAAELNLSQVAFQHDINSIPQVVKDFISVQKVTMPRANPFWKLVDWELGVGLAHLL